MAYCRQRLLGLLLAVFLVFCLTSQRCPASVGTDLQAVSVNVYCPGGTQGSGTIYIALLGDGTSLTWILTANHVVSGLRKVTTIIDEKGKDRKIVKYRDAEVVQEKVWEGRSAGEVRYAAKVVSVSRTRDLALLQVRMASAFSTGAQLYMEKAIPEPGTELYHCGAPGGRDLGGTCSLTPGIVSRIGVSIPSYGGSEHGIFDQVTCAALGGSSGGLVALTGDGRVVGIITLGMRGADSFHWCVPVRSILQFARESRLLWVFDPGADRPEDSGSIDAVLEVSDDTKFSSESLSESDSDSGTE